MTKLIFKSFFIVSIALLFSISTAAQNRITDEEEARSIFEQVEDRRNSISTETAVMEMTITDSRGRTRNRTMKMWSQTEEDNSGSLIVFSEPGNVSGTAFLTIRENGNSSQKLYLPAVGRVQTITSGERGDRFMGSDFTFEDLGDQQAEDYEFEWLEEQDSLYRIRANKPNSDQYDYVEFFIEHDRNTLNEIHYFNSNDEMIKRLEAEEFEQMTDELWSPSKMTMYDLREDRNTVLTWSDREINVSIPDWRFTERGLRRGI